MGFYGPLESGLDRWFCLSMIIGVWLGPLVVSVCGVLQIIALEPTGLGQDLSA